MFTHDLRDGRLFLFTFWDTVKGPPQYAVIVEKDLLEMASTVEDALSDLIAQYPAHLVTYVEFEPQYNLIVQLRRHGFSVDIDRTLHCDVLACGLAAGDEEEMPQEIHDIIATINERMNAALPRHQNMATLFHWDAQALQRTHAAGAVAATRPAPLTTEEVQETLEQLAQHPAYVAQTVHVISESLDLVTLEPRGIRVEKADDVA